MLRIKQVTPDMSSIVFMIVYTTNIHTYTHTYSQAECDLLVLKFTKGVCYVCWQ